MLILMHVLSYVLKSLVANILKKMLKTKKIPELFLKNSPGTLFLCWILVPQVPQILIIWVVTPIVKIPIMVEL